MFGWCITVLKKPPEVEANTGTAEYNPVEVWESLQIHQHPTLVLTFPLKVYSGSARSSSPGVSRESSI